MRRIILVVVIAVSGTLAADPLRLDEGAAVRRALEVANPTAAAAARERAAAARVEQADARALPLVEARARVEQRSSVPELEVRLGGPGDEPVTIFPDITTTYATSLELDQVLYAGGAVEAARERARHELESASAEVGSAAAEIRLQARLAYWGAAVGGAEVAAAEAEIERARRLLEDARHRLEGGIAVPAEVHGADARLAAARLRRVRAVNEREVALARLRSLLHLEPGREIELIDPLRIPPPPEEAGVLLGRVLERRPEVAAARARLEAADAAVRVADAGDAPRLSAQARWDLARPNPRHLPLRDAWDDSWAVALAGRWTVFDGGAADAREVEARALRDAAASELEELTRGVELEVVTRVQELASAREAVTAAAAAVQAARAREEAESERYRDGVATAADVLDAQAELAAAERDRVQSLAGAAAAAALLDRAVGG